MVRSFLIPFLGLLLVGCVPMMDTQSELVFEESFTRSPAGNTAGRAESLAAFKQTVYPLVRGTTCVSCHNSGTRGQSPVFADDDAEKAFDALTLTRKVDLYNPSSSRIVEKILNDSHNCWGNCEQNSREMLQAVERWVQLAPPGGSGGISTNELRLPPENAAVYPQTEWGAVLIQADQSKYFTEVTDGRFKIDNDSGASEGTYLNLTPIDRNPVTNAARSLVIDAARYSSCREFTDGDLQSPRAVRFMQAPIHLNSGETGDSGAAVVDGYKPYSTSLSFNVIRPDKRMDYARMLANRTTRDLSGSLLVSLYDGNLGNTPKVYGGKLPNANQGNAIVRPTGVSVLPHFTPWSTVFNTNGTFKSSGTFRRDEETEDTDLFYLFQGGSYLPSREQVQKNLLRHSFYKKETMYRSYKNLIRSWFYENSNPRSQGSLTFSYNRNIIGIQMSDYFVPNVQVEYRCPDELDGNGNQKDCNANPSYYKYHRVNPQTAGTPLTQDNALDCYTVTDNQLVNVSRSLCDGRPGYFHYIDLFFNVSSNQIATAVNNQGRISTTPSTYTDNENYTNTGYTEVASFEQTPTLELNPDDFFSGASGVVSEADNLNNFAQTLHPVLLSARCVDCHGGGSNAPQFAATDAANALRVLNNNGLIDFSSPANSFRPNGMVHNCNPASTDPRYSCGEGAEGALRNRLITAIDAWNVRNIESASAASSQTWRKLTREERLPGRIKLKFTVTEDGLYNVWARFKAVMGMNRVNFRILDANNQPVLYSTGTGPVQSGNNCFEWTVPTTQDMWEWTTPGRQDELSALDVRGYRLLDDNKNPLALANNRVYFNLSRGEYTLDLIGLSPDLKLDVVGVNRVEGFDPDHRLEFQPDKRDVDQMNIADYKRRVLKYDLSSKLNLGEGKQAFFEIEVKRAFDGQNWIFRNPRFTTIPQDFNVSVKGIKVVINGQHSYSDATYSTFDGVVGDGKVITYAPLVALAQGPGDGFSFRFDRLEVSRASLSQLFPKGTPAEVIPDRRCNELQFFIDNVKPILFTSKVMLTSEIDAYLASFPGSPRTPAQEPQVYNCISCHTQNHPYFKMSTFLNNEEFCREALSRVNFQNFRQSLVIRGINGTGNHPKFVFVEEFVEGENFNWKRHDGQTDYLRGFYRNELVVGTPPNTTVETVIASRAKPGAMMIWSKDDILGAGHPATQWSQLTDDEKTKIARNGLLRRLQRLMIPQEVVSYNWYDALIHDPLLFGQNASLVMNAYDVIRPLNGSIDNNRNSNARPTVYEVQGINGTTVPFTAWGARNGITPLKGNTRQYGNGLVPGFDRTTIDHISTTPGVDSYDDMRADYEITRGKFRDKIIKWIELEYASTNPGD